MKGATDMRTALAVALALGLAACGGSGMHSGGMNSGGINSTVTATALDQAAQGAATTVAVYEAGAAALVTVPDCTAATQQYADRMKPLVAQMDQMGGQMDSTLGSMGWSVHGDVQCSVGSMAMELARHMAAACGLPDMAANRAEIAQHASTMQESANHMRMRAAEVMAMGGGSGMMGSGGGMGGNMGPGWTMPGGGMMGWDHRTPGCAGGTGPGGVSDPPPGAAFADPPAAPTTRNGNVLDVAIEAKTGTSDLGGATATSSSTPLPSTRVHVRRRRADRRGAGIARATAAPRIPASMSASNSAAVPGTRSAASDAIPAKSSTLRRRLTSISSSSPRGTNSMSSPGRAPNASRTALGTVIWP